MTTEKEREDIYTRVFSFLIAHNIQIPVDIKQLCMLLNVELVPLSKIENDTGLSMWDIFELWGNQDGTANVDYSQGRKTYKIAYNDYTPRRSMFTIAEEISHIILGHLEDSSFSIFFQTYKDETYLKYEEEARIAAGLLICPPNFFYKNEKHLNETKLSDLCHITKKCAHVRIDVLNKFRDEISMHPLYAKLPEMTSTKIL